MIDWETALYAPLYTAFGVSATLDAGGAENAVTVIDQTAGIDLGVDDVGRPVISPAVFVKASEITDAGLTEDDLLEATLTLRDVAWTVKNVAARPGPDGKNSGELMLLLINGDL